MTEIDYDQVMANPEDSPNTQTKSSFGAAIKRVRTEIGMTQDELAERATEPGAEFSPVMISKIERDARRVTIEEALALARALNTTVEELVGRQADLRAMYASLNREHRIFMRHVSTYALTLLGVATAADSTQPLSDRDREWLDTDPRPPARLSRRLMTHG
jgi:transcriptional regulator with XRE-family HTH domain